MPYVNISSRADQAFHNCVDAIPLMTFFIECYDRPLAEKYIFVHDHDRSWHYKIDLFDALDRLFKTKYYLWEQDLGR
jgi:hypothetical protein